MITSFVSSCARNAFRRRVPVCRLFSTAEISENPLETVNNATEALKDAATKLESISKNIEKTFTLPATGKEVTLRDIVLHSRDSQPDDFHFQHAVEARNIALPIAETVETDLKNFLQFYAEKVQPGLQRAKPICEEMPCGGATWEVESIQEMAKDIKKTAPVGETSVNVTTPCGRLLQASLDFVQATYDTRLNVTLGSRGALILRLAKDVDAPLASVRQDKEKRDQMGRAFAEQVVPTPWIRSEEEYKGFFQKKEEIEADESS
jgi:hypothetical protein